MEREGDGIFVGLLIIPPSETCLVVANVLFDEFVGVADILFQRSSGNKIYVISVIYLFTSYNVKGFCAGDGIFPLNCFEDSALLELKSLTFDFALFVHIQQIGRAHV